MFTRKVSSYHGYQVTAVCLCIVHVVEYVNLQFGNQLIRRQMCSIPDTDTRICPTKHEIVTVCWVNVEPPSTTVAQH